MSHISFSELKEWTNCPWKHKLNYIDKIRQFKGNEHTAFGTALHTICENLVTIDASNEPMSVWRDYNPLEDFQEQFLNNLKKIKQDTPDIELKSDLIEAMRTQGDHLIQFIIPSLKKTFGKFELVKVEEELYENIPEQEQQFKGFIDLVIYTPEDKKYHIIDWKTCGWGWDTRRKTDKMTTYQLTLYKHFWCKKHEKDYGEVLTHFALLKRTAKKENVEIFKVSNGNKKIENALKLLKKSLYNINNKNYIKNRLSCHGKFGLCEYYKTNHCM